jgi:high-affinity Fe2+/Pb2+ permease
MLDWLTWPADLLLNAGAAVAGLFFVADEPNFVIVQMMVATLILAAIVSLMVFWRGVVEFCRARWKNLRTQRPSRP